MTKLNIATIAEKPTLVLMVNDKPNCNIACTHCYLPYKGVRSPENVLELIEAFKNDYKIVIAGSETLTNLAYLEAYQRAGQNYILTNGILLRSQPEIFDQLQAFGIEELQISLHFGIQKDLRSVPERIVSEVVADAKVRGFRVQISVTISPENHLQVAEMCDRTHEMGADSIKFIKYMKSGSAHGDDRNLLTESEKADFFAQVDAARGRYEKADLRIVIHGNFGPKPGTYGEELSRCDQYCPAGKNLFVIDPNGNVYGCPFLMEHQIGKLTDDMRLRFDADLCNERDKCLTDVL